METQNTLRTQFKRYNFKVATAVELNKCLKEIKLPVALYTCTPISELFFRSVHNSTNSNSNSTC